MRRESARGKRLKARTAQGRASGSPGGEVPGRTGFWRRPGLAVAASLTVLASLLLALGSVIRAKLQASHPGVAATTYRPRPQGRLTFCKDIAPIVYQHCAACHRPDQAAPFSLLTYREVRKHARQIAEVTAHRLMPPWPPEPGYGDFAEARQLSVEEIGILRQWADEGAAEGSQTDLPRRPEWPTGWRLGTPDLVLTMPQAYTLAAEGKDVYHNFVLPIPIPATCYVRAVELRPGNPRVVHHALINVDETRRSRRLAEKQNPPGFDGMELPETSVMPAGQFLGWQPGKSVYQAADGLAWSLKPNTDLVVQMHLHPDGKPETVQPAIGFYFTAQAPTNLPYRLRLVSYDFEIPAGASNYVVEQSYVLPVEVAVLRVNPHAHYLGKDLQGYAWLPNGQKEWLLWIKDWDFNWQGDYQYATPVWLPKGAKVVMHYTYDNSTNNVRNPHHPPQTVRHGLNTTDEMAALGFQVLARTPAERERLARDYLVHLARVLIDYHQFRLRLDPQDAEAHVRLGQYLLAQGDTNAAVSHILSAILLQPEDDKAHYELGYINLLLNRLPEAGQEFRTVIRLNPADSQAYGNLGVICMTQQRYAEAQTYLEAALRLNPDDGVARQNLRLVQGALQQLRWKGRLTTGPGGTNPP